MLIDQIRKKAPTGATHYALIGSFFVFYRIDGDSIYGESESQKWQLCKSDFYLKGQLKPLFWS